MNAIELLIATLVSSLVGSLHCVGMCSPFALLAVGSNARELAFPIRFSRLFAYHFGRLLTYLLMGLVVIFLHSTFSSFSGKTNASQAIGWMVGGLMIWIGGVRLIASLQRANKPVVHSAWVARWTGVVIAIRRRVAMVDSHLASLFWGFASTFLPCGWLYLFVLAAAAAPTAPMTLTMMVAFWLGTLPLLSIVTWGLGSVQLRLQSAMQPLVALFIIAFGSYTILHRVHVDLDSIQSQSATRLHASEHLDRNETSILENTGRTSQLDSLRRIRDAMNLDLPCCIAGAEKGPDERVEHASEASFDRPGNLDTAIGAKRKIGSGYARNP